MSSSSLHKSCENLNGTSNNWSPFVIGVGGGTASGKTTVCGKIMEMLGQGSIANHKRRVVCISQDSFYKPLTEEQKIEAQKGNYDFDHPNSFDNVLMKTVLQDMINGKKVQLPIWDFKTHSRKENDYTTVYPADVILFEGILVFYFPEVRELFHMKLFVDTDPDTRLSRRVIRDVREYCRDLDAVLDQYTYFVKPAFEEFCQPTKKYADIIIPRGSDNEVAIGLIVQTIREYLLDDQTSNPHSSNLIGPRSRYINETILSTSPTSDTYYGLHRH